MAGQENLQIVREIFAAWNAHDIEAFAKRLDQKTTWESDVFPAPFSGHEGARQFFKLAPLHHGILYHAEQLMELRDVAARPRLKLAPEAVNELIDRIERYGTRVDSELDTPGDCRDPKDNYVLGLALAGTAAIILTEDDDLLVLDPWRGIRIMRLFQFLQDHPLPAT